MDFLSLIEDLFDLNSVTELEQTVTRRELLSILISGKNSSLVVIKNNPGQWSIILYVNRKTDKVYWVVQVKDGIEIAEQKIDKLIRSLKSSNNNFALPFINTGRFLHSENKSALYALAVLYQQKLCRR